MVESESRSGLEFEGSVRSSLKRIGFKDVSGGPGLRIGGHQIDCCAGWDDVLVIIECTQSARDGASVRNLILELKGKRSAVTTAFRRTEGYETYRRFELAIATRNITFTEGDREIAQRRPVVHLIDCRTIEYYQRLASLIGQRGAIFNLLGELGIEPHDFDLPRVPALKVELTRNLVGYLFWCAPHDLLKVAYVARRESGREKYYQRMLSAQRLGSLRRFIQHGGLFPNNVIVTFDRRPQFRPQRGYNESWPRWMELGELVFPKSYRSCWVIDGQHRLYAFGDLPPNPSTQKIAVFAFESLPEARQAKFFIEINKEQRPVSPDLIWDLEGEMSPETPEGRTANCVKRLNSIPPLEDMVFLPLSGERKRGQLKMSGLCQDLQATGLLNERTRSMPQAQRNPLVHRVTHSAIPGRAATAVAAFLTEVQTCVGDLWSAILLRPGGITVALNVYEQVLISVGQLPSGEQLRKYASAFGEVLVDLAPTPGDVRKFVREQLSSYAQRRQATEEILRYMQQPLGDPDFGKTGFRLSEPFGERLARFERRLAEVVAECLGIMTIQDLQQRAPEGIWRIVADRVEQQRRSDSGFSVHQAFTLGQMKELMERRDNAAVMMPIFTNPLSGFGDDQAVLSALAGIIRARNAIDHGHRMGNRKLVTAYLETFERLIGL